MAGTFCIKKNVVFELSECSVKMSIFFKTGTTVQYLYYTVYYELTCLYILCISLTSLSRRVQREAFQDAELPSVGRVGLPGPLPPGKETC